MNIKSNFQKKRMDGDRFIDFVKCNDTKMFFHNHINISQTVLVKYTFKLQTISSFM